MRFPSMLRSPLAVIFALLCATSPGLFAQAGGRGGAAAAPGGPPQTVEARTAGMTKIDGYFPLYWEERTGNLYI